MNVKTWITAGFVSALAIACGSSDDGGSSGQQGTPNKAAATQTTQSTITAVQTAFKGTPGSNAGYTSASQLQGAAGQTQQMVTPAAQGGTATQSFLPIDLSSIHTNANPPGTTGTCDCTDTQCTFQGCKTASVTIDGTYAWGGGKIKCTGLKYTVNTAAGGYTADYTVMLDCDMTVTATTLDGTFHSVGSTTASANGNSYQSSWDSTLTFKGVTYPSGGGAPTAGSAHVKASVTAAANGQGTPQTYNADYDVTFPGGT